MLHIRIYIHNRCMDIAWQRPISASLASAFLILDASAIFILSARVEIVFFSRTVVNHLFVLGKYTTTRHLVYEVYMGAGIQPRAFISFHLVISDDLLSLFVFFNFRDVLSRWHIIQTQIHVCRSSCLRVVRRQSESASNTRSN